MESLSVPHMPYNGVSPAFPFVMQINIIDFCKSFLLHEMYDKIITIDNSIMLFLYLILYYIVWVFALK